MALSTAEQLIHNAIRIETWARDAMIGSGSGFFYEVKVDDKKVPVIVTNKHVLKDCDELRLMLHLANDASNEPLGEFETFHIHIGPGNRFIHHPDPAIDLCAIPAGPMIHQLKAVGKRVLVMNVSNDLIPNDFSELDAIEEVTMVGYPNGLFDEKHNLPLVRRGITATSPAKDFNGRPEFLVDMACYPGSSGSPVFLWNDGFYRTKNGAAHMGSSRLHLLGILYAGPQITQQGEIHFSNPVVLTPATMHLGIVIRATALLGLEAPTRALLSDADGIH